MGRDQHGFEGPSQTPMNGKQPMKDGGEYVKQGEITGAYTLYIPVSGVCEVVDTQYNRVKLRTLTKPRKVMEVISEYDHESGKTTKVRKEITIQPSFEVTDGTDVFQDIEVLGEKTYTQSELDAILAEAMEAKKKGTKPKKIEASVEPTRKGVIAKENLEIINPPKDRFANKVQPRDMTPIKGTVATPNLAEA